MASTYVLILSTLIQCLAVVAAIRLIRITGRRLAWSAIAFAALLMAIRRTITLVGWWTGAHLEPPDLLTESVALVIAVLMLGGCLLIAPWFRALGRARDNAKKWAAALETTMRGIAQLDAHGRYREANPEYTRMLALQPDALPGTDWADTFDEPDRRRARSAVAAMLESGSAEAELRRTAEDGSIVCVHALLIKGTWFAGNGCDHYCFLRDVTETQHLQAELKASQRTLSTLLGNLPGMAYRCRNDRDWTLEFVSEGCLALTGWKTDELIGQQRISFNELIHEDDRRRVWMEVQRAVATKRPFSLIYRLKTKTAAEKWVLEQGCALLSDSAEPIALEGFISDFTERMQMEEALRKINAELDQRVRERTASFEQANQSLHREIAEHKSTETALRVSEARIQAILDHATAVIYLKDPHGRYLLVNRRFEDMFHLGREDVIGKTDHDIFPREFADVFRQNDRQVLEAGMAREFEELAALDGRPRTYISLKFPLYDGRDAPYAICGISTDITERKAAEEQLRLAKEAADAANQAKSDFLATMSHELRTPLNGVIGMCDLLLGTDLDNQQRRYAWLAKSSADTLLCLIKDVLDFSKIEAGRLELEALDFDLRYVIENVVNMVASQAAGKSLKLSCSIHPGTPVLVRGDSGRLQQILMNLVGNAIKFTERGEVVVRATADEETPRAAVIRFSVTDTGIGIAPDYVARLFEAFAQQDASMSRRYGGNGLGLAISNRLVEQMGGQIGVQSSLGQGSTFWFTLPLDKQDAESAAPALKLDDLRRVRILVADPLEDRRLRLHRQLANHALDHALALDDASALTLMRQAAEGRHPFGVALLAKEPHELEGDTLAARIKTDPALKDTVLILITSADTGRDAAALKRLGFAGCLSTHVHSAQLLSALTEALISAEAAPYRRSLSPHPEADAAHSGFTLTGRKPRVLIAEDHQISQEVALRVLTKAGFECSVVDDGEQAVEAVRNQDYDLILMDCQMPKVNGFEATQRIREAERAKGTKTPIVALTANAVKGDEQRCLAAGMDSYVSKPFVPEHLVRTVRSYIFGIPSHAPVTFNDHAGAAPSRPADAPPTSNGDTASPPAAQQPEPPASRQPTQADVFAPKAADVPSADTDHPAPAAPAGREPDAPDQPPVLDPRTILETFGGETELARQSLAEFQARCTQDLARLQERLSRGDPAEVMRLSHRLRGAAGLFSAERVRRIAGELELKAEAAQLDDAARTLEALRREVEACLQYDPADLTSATPPAPPQEPHADSPLA